MGKNRERRQKLGLVRQKKEALACGLCGSSSPLTRTHIPPQCAGNRGLVGRRHFVLHEGRAQLSKRSPGGLYVYGLCASCNNLQSRFDDGYRELVAAVRHLWVRHGQFRTVGRLDLPDDEISPGAVARSVLIGFFGLSPHIRIRFPHLADQLLCGQPSVQLPTEVRLRFALARGAKARATGATAGYFYRPRPSHGGPVGIVNLGQVYFPPLAWQLAPPPESRLLVSAPQSLLDREGWADVTAWLQRDPDDREKLSGLCSSLPAVMHPLHHPDEAEWWVEMFSEEITEFVECDNVPRAALDDVRNGP